MFTLLFLQLEKLISKDTVHYDTICFHYYIQFHLHLQVSEISQFPICCASPSFCLLVHKFFCLFNKLVSRCLLRGYLMYSCRKLQNMQELKGWFWKETYLLALTGTVLIPGSIQICSAWTPLLGHLQIILIKMARIGDFLLITGRKCQKTTMLGGVLA